MISSVFHNHSGFSYSRPAPSIAPASPSGASGDTTSDESRSETSLRVAGTPSSPDPKAPSSAVQAETGGAAAQSASDMNEASGIGSSENEETDDQGLTEDEQREVQELRERDREVRAHEQAHLAAAGQYARGGIQYTYERGPDSRMYAVGGQVSVDTSKVPGDPEATLRKAETLRRAALAPAEPSSQDRSVAAEMTRMASEARREIATESRDNVQTAVDAATDIAAPAQEDESSAGTQERVAETLSCPTCGGKHSAQAHDGMMAYAGPSRPPTSTLAAV